MRTFLPFFAIALAGLSVSGCKKSTPANVAATVNGRPITYADVDKVFQSQQAGAQDATGGHEDQVTIQKLEILRVLIDGDLNSYLWLTRFATLYYFAFFLVIMPLVGLRETPKPIRATISEPVLSGGDAMTTAAPASAEKKG